MAVFPRCCWPPSSSSSYGEHTKSPGKRHSLQTAKRGACNWLRCSSIANRQCSQVWARGQHGTRGESEWPEASHLVHCRF
ncbi:hypothetical protein POJ06DRAFT_243195 [Lipomyces tetrasporus]|uniref:Uncharacterized protein n=1 Tax=Lipomyces tetrasporus TaxID=54092 RepID=A0AAD7VV68_9ASCO|nr:uncharacterized protein POJ06DRAFT_243195 [Lipomyces tetrasporus]KAJ8103942.1 hypothetical protein POJ06DRAFT_243195 [Lipomyces tetrasporus]